jgi:hypothetical protein
MLTDIITKIGKKQPELSEILLNLAIKKGSEFVEGKIKEYTGIDANLTGQVSDDTVEKVLKDSDILKDNLSKEIKIDDKALKFKELDVEYEKVLAHDMENAREHHIEMSKSDSWFKANFIEIISIVLVLLGFGVIVGVNILNNEMISPVSKSQITSFAQNILMMVASFWLGSSYGSKMKTNLLGLGSKK